MSLKSFNQTLYSAYSKIDKEAITLKSSFIGLCSDIDRCFRETLSLTIFDKANNEGFKKIIEYYPNFGELDLDQFNRLLQLFVLIRDVNGHVFLNKRISIDDDLISFVSSKGNHEFNIAENNLITIYGAICVCALFGAKYQLWTFVRQTIRHDIFKEIEKENLVEKQRTIQQAINSLVCLKKINEYRNNPYLGEKDYFYLHEILKTFLTKLIFDLERFSPEFHITQSRTKKFKAILSTIPFLANNNILLDKLTVLRNFWVHGYRLFENMIVNDYPITFDFDYLFDVLGDIKKAFLSCVNKRIVYDVHNTAQAMLDFFALRFIEVSYKILDKRLFNSEKISSRIENSLGAYSRLMSQGQKFYSGCKELLLSDEITWFLERGKFDDKNLRKLRDKELDIIELTALDGFDIGGCHFDNKEMVISCVDIDPEFEQTINGKSLKELKSGHKKKYSFMNIYEVEL